MKNTIVLMAIPILIAFFLFIGCAYLYTENNNLKRMNHKRLDEISKLAEEKIHLMNDIEMLKQALREYQDRDSGFFNKNSSHFSSNIINQ